MPVGTKATVKASTRTSCARSAPPIVLANAYHLRFRPGDELVAELGGLHRFMGWDGPILADSGGFQVFSLRHTLLRTDDEGVTFRSVYDGTAELHARGRAADPGEPRLRCRHVSRHLPAGGRDRRQLEAAVRRTTLWARRQVGAQRAQASCASESRRAAMRSSAGVRSRRSPTGFDGNALGGLSVGEDRDAMARHRGVGGPAAPADKPRPCFMGIADPEGILDVVERGIDLFDCVLPTRVARTGSARSPGRAG